MKLRDFTFEYEQVKIVNVWLQTSGNNTTKLGANIFLPDDFDLNNNIICGLNVLLLSDVNNVVENGQSLPVFNQDVQRNFLLSIARRTEKKEDEDEDKREFYIKDYPLVMFSNTVMDGNYRATKWEKINAGQSYITVKSMTGVVTGRPLILVFYLLSPEKMQEYYEEWDKMQAELNAKSESRGACYCN